jgi:hypothetical protein
VKIELEPGEAEVVAALPYEVAQLEMTTLETAKAGDRLPVALHIDAGDDMPGDHLVRLDLIPLVEEWPEPMRHYAREAVCRESRGEGYFPIALNEKPGSYKIVARDLLSGVTAEQIVQIIQP